MKERNDYDYLMINYQQDLHEHASKSMVGVHFIEHNDKCNFKDTL